jgi:hypothetical protein
VFVFVEVGQRSFVAAELFTESGLDHRLELGDLSAERSRSLDQLEQPAERDSLST